MSQIKLARINAERAVRNIYPELTNEQVLLRIQKFTNSNKLNSKLKADLKGLLALEHSLGWVGTSRVVVRKPQVNLGMEGAGAFDDVKVLVNC